MLVSATPPSGQSLDVQCYGLPTGLSIDPEHGLISGTISAGAATSSPFTTTVTAATGTLSKSYDVYLDGESRRDGQLDCRRKRIWREIS